MLRNTPLRCWITVAAVLLSLACTPARVEPTSGAAVPVHKGTQDAAALAAIALAQIDDPAVWVVAATELAEAFVAQGRFDLAASLLERAKQKADALEDLTSRTSALTGIAPLLASVGQTQQSAVVIDQARRLATQIDDENVRWDVEGKLCVALAAGGAFEAALACANAVPVTTDTLASYKARTLHDIAPLVAAAGELVRAEEALQSITMGLTYYAAAARTDVAIYAHQQDASMLAQRLLTEAEAIARDQTDGYFIAGALRHVAVARLALGQDSAASDIFTAAVNAARRGASPQHKARAVSRVATSLADYGRLAETAPLLDEALALAATESRDTFRYWCLYEIAGSAAFAGFSDKAKATLADIPSDLMFGGKSLAAATQRDVAWGMARHGNMVEAIALAEAINSPRERVQALSRIARVAVDPAMKALPRYL